MALLGPGIGKENEDLVERGERNLLLQHRDCVVAHDAHIRKAALFDGEQQSSDSRSMDFDATGLPWINPSPNMRSLTEATLYPGVGLVEGTNVSVGRGTDTPFELLGAPWIKGKELAQYLNARNISGVRFVPITFTPSASNYSGQKCEGVNIFVVERNALDSGELGIELASALHKLYPEPYHMERMIELLGNQSVYDAIVSGQDPRRIAEDWREPLEKFLQVRQKYLIYK